MNLSKSVFPAAALVACLSISACRSAFIQTSIVNHSGATARLVEVDYPGGSFGTQQIAEGATYHYHFKVLDVSGPLKITYTGQDNKVHTVNGPVLDEGQEGSLTITLDGNGEVAWFPQLKKDK